MEAPMRYSRRAMVALGGLALLVSLSTAAVGAGVNSYVPTILTSDSPSTAVAPNYDPNLKNPWGLSYSATSPFWNADQNTGLSTLYNANGMPQALVVTIPGGSPTGTVQNSGTMTDFPVGNGGNGARASFIFDTLNGTIAAWNSGSTAFVQPNATVAGASFTGLALANNGTQNQLYAADFNATTGNSSRAPIDVFGPTFNPVALSSTAFVDPMVPAGLHPYNIQAVMIPGLTSSGMVLVVTYRSGPPGTGAVAYFDANGTPLNIRSTDSHLLNPWGVTIVPPTASFGAFNGALLVGNVANDQINAFNPNTLAPLGTLMGPNGQQPIALPGGAGLWALGFRQPGSTFDPNALYFNAGVNGGGNFFQNGIFGAITPVPEPASVLLLGLGLTVVCGVYCRRAIVTRNGLGRDRGH
jgi:uncharacterized protein (TIGR03118 family)